MYVDKQVCVDGEIFESGKKGCRFKNFQICVDEALVECWEKKKLLTKFFNFPCYGLKFKLIKVLPEF